MKCNQWIVLAALGALNFGCVVPEEGGSDGEGAFHLRRGVGAGSCAGLDRAVIGTGGGEDAFRSDQDMPWLEQDA